MKLDNGVEGRNGRGRVGSGVFGVVGVFAVVAVLGVLRIFGEFVGRLTDLRVGDRWEVQGLLGKK